MLQDINPSLKIGLALLLLLAEERELQEDEPLLGAEDLLGVPIHQKDVRTELPQQDKVKEIYAIDSGQLVEIPAFPGCPLPGQGLAAVINRAFPVAFLGAGLHLDDEIFPVGGAAEHIVEDATGMFVAPDDFLVQELHVRDAILAIE